MARAARRWRAAVSTDPPRRSLGATSVAEPNYLSSVRHTAGAVAGPGYGGLIVHDDACFRRLASVRRNADEDARMSSEAVAPHLTADAPARV